jgi:pyruvate,water dikinase
MSDYPNSRQKLRSDLGVGVNPDEKLGLIDQIVGRYGLAPLADGRSDSCLIKGIPVAPGVAVGRAVVIQSTEDLKRIRPNVIPICSRMRPVYSIVLQVARGIISERGGILSTAATIAREYGLPAVTGVRSAQLIISDGDLIKIDGTDGSVQILVESVNRAVFRGKPMD